jgi:hypothetical protein
MIIQPTLDCDVAAFVESVSTDTILDTIAKLVPSLRPGTIVRALPFGSIDEGFRYEVPARGRRKR